MKPVCSETSPDRQTAACKDESQQPWWPPKYSLRRFLVSTTIMAAGILTIASGFLLPGNNPYQLVFPFCWFGGAALLGAGIFNLFRLPGLGAIVGFAVQVGIVIVIVLLYLLFWPAIG